MAIDGLFVKHLTNELSKELTNSKINKITAISDYELLFKIKTNDKNVKLFLSSNNNYSRIHLTTQDYTSPKTATNLTMVFRKYLENGRIETVKQIENDRIIVIHINKNDELGNPINYELYVEIMGKHSNIILVKDNVIIYSTKMISNFLSRTRIVLPKTAYTLPLSDKVNPFKTDLKIEDYPSYQGISKQIINEINYTNNINVINNPVNPTIFKSEKPSFYFCDLTHEFVEKQHFNTLSELLDNYFFNKDSFDRVKQKNKDLQLLVKRNIEKQKSKIIKLEQEKIDTSKFAIYQKIGELLLNNASSIQKGLSNVEVFDYYENTNITIKLDEKKTAIENSNDYYKKAKKLKLSVKYIDEQILIATNELEYFTEINSQLEYSDLNDIEEIKSELIELRYIKKSQNKEKNKKKKIPSFLSYKLDNDFIFVGKNNIQNSYLTHKHSKPTDYWFHVQNSPASHVILRTEKLTEKNIRQAANLAALYSPFKNSSSVPVDYTLIKNVKKIPGKLPCFVTITNQKTIYIDPDFENTKVLELIK